MSTDELLFEYFNFCEADLTKKCNYRISLDEVQKFVAAAFNKKKREDLKCIIDPETSVIVQTVEVECLVGRTGRTIRQWLELWLLSKPPYFKVVRSLVLYPEKEVADLKPKDVEFHSGNFYRELRFAGHHHYLI